MQSAGASPPKCWLLSWTGEVWTLCSHADSVQPSDYINWKCIDVNKRLTPAFWSLQSEISLCTRPHTDFCSDVFFFFLQWIITELRPTPCPKRMSLCVLYWHLYLTLNFEVCWVEQRFALSSKSCNKKNRAIFYFYVSDSPWLSSTGAL